MVASGHASGSAVMGTTVAMTVLAALTVISRLFTRIAIVQKPGIDDICIAIALMLTIALTVTMCQQVRYGMGRHETSLSLHDKVESAKWFWSSVWIYYLSLCFTKVSILLQYLRVFVDTRFRISCFILMGVIIAYSTGTFFSSIFACTPVAYFWDQSLNGHCVNHKAVWFANASINIVTDICTGVLPLPTLRSLNLPKRQKYALMAVFGLGGITCIISILRLQSLYIVSETDDISWNNPLAAIWSSTETNVGIICSCLPTLKGCVSRVVPRLLSSTESGARSSRYGIPASIRSGQPRRGQVSWNELDHELRKNEKYSSKSHVHSRLEDEDARGPTPSPSLGYPYDGHIMVHTQITQKDSDEAALGETESVRRLNPTSSYHAV